jgi:undecaprenyl-diphosphatase
MPWRENRSAHTTRIAFAALMVATTALLCLAWLASSVSRGKTTLLDGNVRLAIHSISSPWMTRLFLAITLLGSQACVIGLSACAAITMFLKRQIHHALVVVATMGGAELWLSLLKHLFHRQRPEAFFDVHLPESYSFPSGHALLSFCCYGLLCTLVGARRRRRGRWLIGICGAALILAIGVSRVYLGVHHPTDVVGGYLVAIAWGSAIVAVYAGLGTMKS